MRVAAHSDSAPTPGARRPLHRFLTALVWVLPIVALAVGGFWDLFTTFKFHDDEGYVLYSLHHFAAGGALYTEVYSQYGPFFFLFNDTLHRLLGFEFTHDASRGLTLLYWVSAAVLGAATVHRHARAAFPWVVFAAMGTFVHLRQMTFEPMHPGGFIAFVVAGAAWSGANAVAAQQARKLALVIGIAGAVLVFTKINVGVLLLASSAAWLLLQVNVRGWTRLAQVFGVGILGLVPWVLMRPLLGDAWVVTFAVVVASAGLGMVLVTRSTATPWFPPGKGAWLIGSFGLIAVVVVAMLAARGTGLTAMIDGMLLAPLRHPTIFSLPLAWLPGAGVLAVISLGLGIATLVTAWRGTPWFAPAVAALRLVAAIATAVTWLLPSPFAAPIFALSYGLPLLWLLVIPLRTDAQAATEARVRSWLAGLLVLQSLHAYPVAGSQLGWGTFLWVPLLTMACVEAASVLSESTRRWLGAAALIAALGALQTVVLTPLQRWRDGESLGLPGASLLRLPGVTAAGLRMLSLNAATHSDTLFSLPGLYSFNLWTGRPTPNGINATLWFSLLSLTRQNEILQRLKSDPRAAVIVERVLLTFDNATHAPFSPLRSYLETEFSPVLATGSHEFWVKRGRTVAPLSTAAIFRRAASATGAAWRLEMSVANPSPVTIATVEWIAYASSGAGRRVLTLTAANSQLEVTPIVSSGANAGPSVTGKFPIVVPPLARLVIDTDEALGELPMPAVVRLRDANGALAAEAVFTR
ncbi:hypothetical protein [Horticoccus sp. 23ND18S-11]|uniref:hypothetical protein n=1 Tax=Horticoccus sp. 23ND18S-11 TaxID=3391832 RepID=UPI0039C94FCB